VRLKLTDLAIQHFKFQHPQVTYWDTMLPAFGVRVGSRSKTFIVMQGKTRKRQTIGHYPDTKLQAARDKARLLLTSPQIPEHTSVLASDAVEEYLRGLSTRPRTAADYERLLKRHFIPALGHRKLADISARDILAITDRLLGTPSECRHAHVAMQTFFNACVRRTYIDASPMAALAVPTKAGARDRVLSYDELKRIWKAADHLADFGKMVRLCVITGQRRGEMAKIQSAWHQTDGLTIPKEVAKNKREHTIPLTPLALSLAQSAPLKIGNWGRKKDELDRLSQTAEWVLHDLRRTFSTNLAQLQVAPHIIERILNHASGTISGVAATYNRYAYLGEMRVAMERYEQELARLGVL
jgi:integrase